jgi:F-type H+-transporting ATPase subunit delta
MIDRSLTRRYVAAVHSLAAEAGQVDLVRDELGAIQVALQADERLLTLLRHPKVALADKRDLLLRLAGPAPSPILAGLVNVVLDRKRPEALLGAGDVFIELADEAAGVVRARVEVAVMPTPDQQARLRAALARLLGAPVATDFAVAPEVIGGARVRVGGRLIDGSLSGSLDRLSAGLRAS